MFKIIAPLCIVLFISAIGYAEPTSRVGLASWYGGGEKLNVHTANGEVFNPNDYTAAIWDYPFGAILEVTNLDNNLSVKVKVNDRGPNKRLNRLIDLSRASFLKISPLSKGIIRVKIRVCE